MLGNVDGGEDKVHWNRNDLLSFINISLSEYADTVADRFDNQLLHILCAIVFQPFQERAKISGTCSGSLMT